MTDTISNQVSEYEDSIEIIGFGLFDEDKIINIPNQKRTGAFTCPHCGKKVKAYSARTLIKTPYGTIAF